MATIQRVPVTVRPSSPATRAALSVSRWVLAIVGGIAAFLGGFILLGGDNQYVGLGGDLSWRVSEIDPMWGWGLLIGGAVFLVGGILLFLRDRGTQDTGAAAIESPGLDLAAHAVIFTLVNSLLWAQDVLVTGGVNYVLWVTIPWAVGLGIQAVGYLVGRRT